MKLQDAFKQYIIIAALPMIALIWYKPYPYMLRGYIIGMLLSITQIWYSFVKSNTIADIYGKIKSKSAIFTFSMFLPSIIIIIILITVVKILGQYALFTCILSLLLQKPALYKLQSKIK